ncbi:MULTISPECIES: recombinase family protein [Rhodococcus]|uniref:recombinase family protein n=1 Tax=Rhodococcus TaxID=1827 RepID=UPI001D8C26C0|nr:MULTISPECIES: recombinase family protein [Rhodococcus]MBW0288611.1 hypothetical protein [Rhodococcus sp. MH15]MEA1798741.1 recombinase family protein [Rhodococcus qingshengii]
MACEVLVELEIVAPQGNLSLAYFESEYLDLEQNPKLQQHALRRAGAIRIFTDYESGSKTQRPQLTECLNYLRENDGDVLVVWKLDRLGRSVRHVIDTVHNLGERGIAFRFLAEGFDTATAGGEFLFRIMAALAQMERRMIVERAHAASKPPTVMTPHAPHSLAPSVNKAKASMP